MFSFKSKDQRKVEEEKRKVNEAIAEAKEKLRECLLSDSFKKYREALEDCHKDLISCGISIMKNIKTVPERIAAYDMLFSRAEVLGLLLEEINSEKQ